MQSRKFRKCKQRVSSFAGLYFVGAVYNLKCYVTTLPTCCHLSVVSTNLSTCASNYPMPGSDLALSSAAMNYLHSSFNRHKCKNFQLHSPRHRLTRYTWCTTWLKKNYHLALCPLGIYSPLSSKMPAFTNYSNWVWILSYHQISCHCMPPSV